MEAQAWKQAWYEDHRRLVIQTQFHKCGKSCYKKGLCTKRGTQICRFGCMHVESLAFHFLLCLLLHSPTLIVLQRAVYVCESCAHCSVDVLLSTTPLPW